MASSRDRSKGASPPAPLLLMPASSGLTFNESAASSLLMPVVQTEATLMTGDEDGEADSFLGQAPPVVFPSGQATSSIGHSLPKSSSNPSLPFQSMAPPAPLPQSLQHPPGAFPPPSSFSGISTPPSQAGIRPSQISSAPPGGPSKNYHRASGRPKYAPPPPGTYAESQANMPQYGSPPASVPFSGAPPSLGTSPLPTSIGALPARYGAPSVGFGPSTSMGPPSNFGPPQSQQSGFLPQQSGFGPKSYSGAATGAFQTLPASIAPPPMNTGQSNLNAAPSQFAGQGLSSPDSTQIYYVPVRRHWFYSKHVELQQIWKPFSMRDSMKLEEAFRSGAEDNVIMSTDGGRYDVDLIERTRTAIYWDENPSQVRRSAWFYRPEGDSRFVPFEEDVSDKLEEIYKVTLLSHEWHKRHDVNGEVIIMHSPSVFVSFKGSGQPDEWGTTPGDQRPRVVKRGTEEIEGILEGEPEQIDHLVFVVHGIGPTCDLRFRNIIECVDDFRDMSQQMVQSHFSRYQLEGKVGRVEFLPVKWHQALHGDATGVDRKLKSITLKSIGKLRHYTNDTLLDILFYTSPTYAQQIADTVGTELNRLLDVFQRHNPGFTGGVSVAGHSLGSLILFDLLVHQIDPDAPPAESTTTILPAQNGVDSSQDVSLTEEVNDLSMKEDIENISDFLNKLGLSDYLEKFQNEEIDLETLIMCEESDIKEIGIPMGPRKKIQGYLKKLAQKKQREEAEQALAASSTVVQSSVSNITVTSDIFAHDPLLRSASQTSVNYMMGAPGIGLPFVRHPQLSFSPANFFALGSPISMFLTVRGVDMLGEDFCFPTCPGFFNIFHPFDPVAYRLEPMITSSYPPKPYLIPHHKGRKRMHLELKENLARMGADLKQKMMSYFKTTWKTINDFALAHRNNPQGALEEEMDNVMSEISQAENDTTDTESIVSVQEEDIYIGSINQGRRVDCVLQEKPIESFNDYLFALGSHGCYWESEDTVLLLLKEIYAAHGIVPIRPGQPNILSPLRPEEVMAKFPRHPMASPLLPSMGPTTPSGVDWRHSPAPADLQPGNPLTGVSQSGRVAPPPLAGFMRK